MLGASALAATEEDADPLAEKPWVEAEAQLPAFPVEADLIPFRVGAVADTQFLIDGKSLSIGGDGVVRYTVLVISAAGARNVSYEGIRCATAERRIYAFGHADGTWSKARNARWVKIRGGSNNHVAELYGGYFCRPGDNLSTADDLRRVLRTR